MTTLASATTKNGALRERGTARAAVFGAAALAVLGFSGYFKGVASLNQLPVDPTVLGLVLVAFAMAMNVLQRRLPSLMIAAVVLGLWATFLPAVVIAPATEAADRKILLLLTATLACALGPFVLDRRGLKVWIGAQVVAGIAMVGVLMVNRDSAVVAAYQRLTVEEVTTIASARVLGGAVLVLLLVGLARRRWRLLCLGASVGGVVLMLQVASRGPTLSLALALVVLAALTQLPRRGQRVLVIGSGVVAGAIFLAIVLSSQAEPVRRLAGLLTGDDQDRSREFLYGLAVSRIADAPQGMGWGGFGTIPSTSPYTNSEGQGYPHNFFLEIGVEAGWLALVATIAYCLLCLVRLQQRSEDLVGRILFGLALYWLLVAQTSSDVNGNRMTWIALSVGLIGSASRRTGAPS